MNPHNGDSWEPRSGRRKKKKKTTRRPLVTAGGLQEGQDDVVRASQPVLPDGEAPSETDLPLEEATADLASPDETSEQLEETGEQPDGQLPRRSKSPDKKKTDRRAIDYIPVPLFLAQSVFSFGIYPYLWLLRRIDSFPDVGIKGLDRAGMAAYCIVGLCVQLLLLCATSTYVYAWLVTDNFIRKLAVMIFAAYALSFVLLVMPGRCFHHFNIRWRLRRIVAEWDAVGVMIDRTMTSLTKLFLFGSAYIQYHFNRLIGMGMPGFSGYEEIAGDFSVTGAVRDYLKAGQK